MFWDLKLKESKARNSAKVEKLIFISSQTNYLASLQKFFMSLVVLGTVAIDAIETPFGKVDKISGGSGNYIAWSASNFTDDVDIVAVIGNDFPMEELEALKKRGVDLEGLQIKENEKSFFWKGVYHMDMNSRDTLVTDLNVLADFDPILPDSYKNADYVMLGNLTPAVQQRLLDQLESRPKLVALDTMNFWIQNPETKVGLDKVLKQVDILIINDEEARMLGNNHSVVKCARKIMDEMGPKFVIVKKGEHGALLFHKSHVFFAPALPLEEVFDPTGAGDTFAGGFMGFLAMTKDVSFENMKRAIIYGSAMASFCVERFGNRRLMEVTKSEINERIQEFIDLVQFDIELTE